MIGKQFAHYEIHSRLGAGGMGEVYLAEDTRLRRKVALKLLPLDQITDPEKLKRFEQEAYATSALNHPNITTIFETGDVDELHYITIEYIDGKTLRQLFEAGRLELRQVLDIGVQVAEGLAAAHQANVVHRDLKPENIMVREDGIVKILDFGLAKLSRRLMDEVTNADNDDTIVQKNSIHSQSITEPGMVLGTVSYMSPEQARGQEVDFRSDIFSFGSILYEALAQRRTFQRGSSVETMTAIIRETPEPLQELAPQTPPELVRIIRKALAKDANERYQSGKDLALDLKALRREVESDSVSAAWPATSGSTPAVPAASSRRRLIVGALVIAGLAATTFFMLDRLRTTSVAPAAQLAKTQITTTGTATQGILSPGGRLLAYLEKRDDKVSLWIRQLGAGTDVQIIEPTEKSLGGLAFTPDGEWILFTTLEPDSTVRHLMRIPTLGGVPREIVEDVDSTPSFAPDGKTFYFLRNVTRGDQRFFSRTLDGSKPEKEIFRKPEGLLGVSGPTVSADGREIAFYQIEPDGLFRPSLQILNLETRETTPLSHPEWVSINGVHWKPNGSGLYVTAQRQWVSKSHVFEVNRNSSGTHSLTRGFDNYMQPSLSADGSMMAVTRSSIATKILSIPTTGTTQDNTLAARSVVTGTGHNNDGSYSPDGTRVVYVSSTDDQLNLWTMNPDGSDRRQLTFDQSQIFAPQWSPDGERIAFGAESEGNLHVWVMDADGRNPRRLSSGTTANFGHSWSPDSQWLCYIKLDGHKGQLFKAAVTGGEPQRFGDQKASIMARWSPDGEWILSWKHMEPRQKPVLTLFATDGSDRERSIDASKLGIMASPFQFIGFRWGQDMDTLYCIQRLDGVRNITRLAIADGTTMPITQFSDQDLIFSFSLAPDESQMMVTRGVVTSDVVIFRNFD